jgi:hypothetical protein
MGWSANKLRELGIKEDERLNEQKRRFMPGQEVKIINSQHKVEDGWTVKGYRSNFFGNGVLVENGRDVRRYSEDLLLQFQEQANFDQNELILDSLRKYINEPNKANILADGRIVKGQFQGYKVSNNNVYIGDTQGNRIGEVPASDFLSWQEKQTDEEILNDQEARLAPYIDKEYPEYKDDGSASTVKVEYDKERQKVTLTSPEGITDEYSIEEFLDNIKAVLDQYDRVDREFPTGERKFNLGQKVKGKSMGELSDGWTVEDFSRLANGEIWVTIKKDDTEKKVEQENLLSWQNSTEASGGDNGGSGNGGESSENDSENKKKKRTPKEETRLKPLENRLKELKQKKVRKSGIQFVQSKWKEHMSKYDVGETAKERKLNERKKRVRFILGGVALAPFFPLEVAVVVGASPLYLSDHYIQYRRRKNLHNKIHKQEVLIRDEEEQIRHENEKARQKERERQNVGS